MKGLIFISVLLIGNLYADGWSWGQKKGVAPVTDKLYIEECASCHFGYQAGLLPSRSWKKVMSGLDDHFGTDASLEPEDNQKILKYLVNNSAEKFTNYKRSKRINNSISRYSTPIAITKTPYMIKKHKQIPIKLIKQKEVSSLANCKTCHTTADKGIYRERDILIPNYGKWDD